MCKTMDIHVKYIFILSHVKYSMFSLFLKDFEHWFGYNKLYIFGHITACLMFALTLHINNRQTAITTSDINQREYFTQKMKEIFNIYYFKILINLKIGPQRIFNIFNTSKNVHNGII